MFEKRLNQLYGQRENVEKLINAMEVVAFNAKHIEKLKAGKNELQQAIKEVYVYFDNGFIFTFVSYPNSL